MEPDGFQQTTERPRLCIGTTRAAWFGPGLDLSPHRNVATTIAISMRDEFELRTWADVSGWDTWRAVLAAVIPSESLHHLRSRGPMCFLYLDPLSDDARSVTLARVMDGRERLRNQSAPLTLSGACVALGLRPRPPVDPRIARVAREIERRPDAFSRVEDAATVAALSASRFRALFVRDIGLPFRRYRLWRRMAMVMRVLAAGGDLTRAAHASGFASSAHLSAAFRGMFGLAPSELRARGMIIDLTEDGEAA